MYVVAEYPEKSLVYFYPASTDEMAVRLVTALDLIKNGYNVTLIDECISSRDPKNKSLAYANLKNISIKPLEMVAFELLKSAEHSSFKTISKLIK